MIPPEVRHAQPDDISALHALDDWPSEVVWLEKIRREEVLVLEFDGDIVGLVRYCVMWCSVPFIGMFVIAADHHGQGFSRLLLNGLCDWLVHKGFVAVLSSSQTNEPGPQAWHIHMGFHSNGLIENIEEEGIGELVYRKLL